jgi:hypothetical protein
MNRKKHPPNVPIFTFFFLKFTLSFYFNPFTISLGKIRRVQHCAIYIYIHNSTNYYTILILLLHIITYDLLHVSTLIRHLQGALRAWLKLHILLINNKFNFSQAQMTPCRWRINVETCRSKSYAIIYNKIINIVW